jgi:hypothetical protein
MEFNKLVFGGLAIGCLAAAAAGGYLAARQDRRAEPATTPSAIATPISPAPAAGKPVEESEGVITPETPAPRAEPQAAPTVRERSRRAAATDRPERTVTAPPRESRASRTAPPANGPAETVAAPTPQPAVSGAPSMWEVRPAVEPDRAPAIERAPVEPEPPAPPPAPERIELVIPTDAVLGLQIERTVSSETARVEDRVDARVTRDVRVGDRVAIPSGSVVEGSVMEVERGGKVKERARLGIRFHTVVLADGTRLNVRTDSVVRLGSPPANESAAKIGGAAIGGAILGAILGGGKGAVLGGTMGAAGGTAATMAGGRNPAVLPAGSTVTVRMQQPVTVTVEE